MTPETFVNAAGTHYGEESAPAPAVPARQTDSEEIVNAPAIVKAFGREYAIKRFSMAQVFRSVEHVAPFSYVLKQILMLPRQEITLPDGKKQQQILITDQQKMEFAITALSISGPSALGLISVATNEPIEWLEMDDKNPLDGLRVLAAVLEKNLDFFTPENIDEVTRMVGGLTRAVVAFSGSTSMT